MQFKNYKEVNKKYDNGSNWLTLKEGSNKIRIVSEFEDYGEHFDSSANRSTICIGKEQCVFCQKGDKPRVKFLGWALDRLDKKVKLLRVGYQIFNQLGELACSEEYGFTSVPGYDITITKSGQKLETVYTVLPARANTELTTTEKEEVLKVIKPVKDIIDTMKAKVALPDTQKSDLQKEEFTSEEEEPSE